MPVQRENTASPIPCGSSNTCCVKKLLTTNITSPSLRIRILLIALLIFLPLSAQTTDSTDVSPNLIHTAWFSRKENISRRVDIYIPPSDTVPSTVLYLIHGINGYEGSWVDKGFAIDTLHKLMEDGRCKPMILVMPDCNKWPLKQRPTHHSNLWKCLIHYPKLSREHEIEYAISDLIDMIDSTYHVSSTAILGLSDGARMASNVANIRQDRIQFVGLFSPVLHKDQLPKDSSQNYAIYVGKSDIFYSNGKRFHRRMKKAGYPHQFIEMQGSHNWRMWRNCLSKFMEQWSRLSVDGPRNRPDSENR